ncbi:hypothetical protein Pan181_05920 [Aeoliella mucimassa]|uniref:Uncharacterized protein n=2 Tax=Aeoliella mucimassa TaxID=2527972 RepID=A0A518AI60_9BACT|nr:hypothetical protein Pan181_05920 [Aeoliella mucimassa]
MLLVHIMARKWDENLPFPSVSKLAEEMGLSVSQLRARLSTLEKKGIIKRVFRKGRSNCYDPTELIKRLEAAIESHRPNNIMSNQEALGAMAQVTY